MDKCIEWHKYRDTQGYGHRWVPGHRMQLAHRVAYCEEHGLSLEDIAEKVVRHKCDNPGCINPGHLEIGTNYDNVQDRVHRGRSASMKGQDHGRSTMTERQALEILERYKPKCKKNGAKAISRETGITYATIMNLVQARTWQHLPRDTERLYE